jgi:hypothetical protein
MHRFTRMLSRELTLTDYLGDSSFSPAETQTISALARAGAGIAGVLARGKRAAFSGHDNVHGERVRDYDVIANDLFVDALSQAPGCAGVHSEELVEPLRTNEQAGELLVFLDPLDGSANLDSHGLCGSIFGIAPVAGGVSAAALQTGQGLLRAGYFLYSSATLLVLASRERVDLFLYDPELSSFTLAEQDLRCPSQGKLYATNEARVSNWSSPAQGWLSELKSTLTGLPALLAALHGRAGRRRAPRAARRRRLCLPRRQHGASRQAAFTVRSESDELRIPCCWRRSDDRPTQPARRRADARAPARALGARLEARSRELRACAARRLSEAASTRRLGLE